MEKYIGLYIAAGIIVVILALVSTRRKGAERIIERKEYEFTRRDYIMTRVEGELFRRLENMAGDRYYIFPQVHLSSLLDHKVNGQNWKGALSTIQRKSVDFALVDRVSLRTVYVVELDDTSHDQPDRQQRDGLVEKLLLGADIPLVRLRNIDTLTDEDIDRVFRDAHERREI